MRPVVLSQTGAGNTAPGILDYIQTPFNVSISVIVSGTVNYTVQHTFDDAAAPGYNPSAGNWFPHDNADLVAATTNQNDNFAFPARASRLVVNSGTGTATMTLIQGLGE